MKTVAAAGLILLLCVGTGVSMFYVVRLFTYEPDAVQIAWEDMGPTPMADSGFTPQGLTWAEGYLIFANSWKNRKSRVYKIDPKDMAIAAHFDMPPEAVHTSGLAWDGSFLWGVDYRSNRVYKMNMDKSFTKSSCVCLGSFASGFKGTSASCFIDYSGQSLLVISDFMHSRRVIAVDPDACLRSGGTKGNIVWSYVNHGFSQGLVSDGTNLLESENKKPVGVINRIDISRAISGKRFSDAIVKQYKAPHFGVEDLAFDGEYFWTSDETTFRFYRARLP